MKMTYTDVQAPTWTNTDKTAINCRVKFDKFEDYLPFTASLDDVATHGQDIYNECLNGDWGDIAECPAPRQLTSADLYQRNTPTFKTLRTAAVETLTMLQCITTPNDEQSANIVSVQAYLAELANVDLYVPAPAWPDVPACVIV